MNRNSQNNARNNQKENSRNNRNNNYNKDSNGNFKTPPIITINFIDETHSSLGLTLRFSELNYCTHLKIQYYNSNNELLSEKEFYPNNYNLRQQTLFRKSKQHISPANEEIKNLQKRSEITTFVPIRALRGRTVFTIS